MSHDEDSEQENVVPFAVPPQEDSTEEEADDPRCDDLIEDVNEILADASGDLYGVVVLGYRKDCTGYFTKTNLSNDQTLWLLERCKHRIMMHEDECVCPGRTTDFEKKEL